MRKALPSTGVQHVNSDVDWGLSPDLSMSRETIPGIWGGVMTAWQQPHITAEHTAHHSRWSVTSPWQQDIIDVLSQDGHDSADTSVVVGTSDEQLTGCSAAIQMSPCPACLSDPPM
ncbi:hypothetical protein KEM60_03337 [Austwickia sp. TVS 96-490-7B]|nr:hypothetical protein [Austwickia sp. TVS 96-490-7B]